MSTEITTNDLQKYASNPEMVIKKVLDLVDSANGEEVAITNATSPFAMLLCYLLRCNKQQTFHFI